MTDPIHQQLLGHLLGALDDDEQERVDAQLDHDEECRRSLLDWRRRLARMESMRPDFEPPKGLAERTCRLVAAYRAATAGTQSAENAPCMTPAPIPPCRSGTLGWLDVTTIGVLLMTAVVMILPAIDGSRFEARLASCQEGLHQLGLALSQYADRHQSPITHFADRGRLTPPGLHVAGLMQNGFYADTSRPVCPSTWLAVQGVACPAVSEHDVSQHPEPLETPQPRTAFRVVAKPFSVGSVFITSRNILPVSLANSHPQSSNDWPGAWRDGTTDDRQLPESPADVPLLADAPSADLPGQAPASHRGLGRNLLYRDGRVHFATASKTIEPIDGVTTPILWVGEP